MQRLVRNLVLFLSIFTFCVFAILSYLSIYNINYRPFRNKFYFYMSGQNSYDSYILGDSIAEFGVDTRLMGNAINLAYRGGGFRSATKALILHDTRLKGKKIIAVVGQAALNDFRINNRFLALVDDFLAGDWGFILKNWNYHTFQHLNTFFTCQFFHCSYFDLSKQQFKLEDRGFFVARKMNVHVISDTDKFALQYTDYLNHFTAQSTLVPTFIASLRLLQEKGAEVYVVFPPYRQDAKEGFVNDQSDIFYQKIDNLARVNHFTLIDLRTVAGITNQDFMDPVHLNSEGARKFTKKIMNQLVRNAQ